MKAALAIQESLPGGPGADRVRDASGSLSCFIRSLDAHRSRLKCLVHRRIGPHLVAKVDASDIVQEAFMIAVRNVQRCQARSATEQAAWLRGILLNVLRMTQRRFLWTIRYQATLEVRGDEVMDGLEDSRTSPSEIIRKDEGRERLAAALRTLPERDRQLVLARYWERLSYEEIAERLGMTPGAAQKARARAVLKLKRILDDGNQSAG